MAILLDQPQADACIAALDREETLAISAGTVAESLIVSARRNVGQAMTALIDGIGFEIVAVTQAEAKRVAAAYAKWGKGVDPTGLNFGDCFAYALAKERGCPLLFVGQDFARTDVGGVC